MNLSKIQNEMLIIRIKTIYINLKESIKAVIVCVQIIPIIFDQILLLTSLVSKY